MVWAMTPAKPFKGLMHPHYGLGQTCNWLSPQVAAPLIRSEPTQQNLTMLFMHAITLGPQTQ